MAATVIVENGTGVTNANSLLSVSDAVSLGANRQESADFLALTDTGPYLIESWRLIEENMLWFGERVLTTATRTMSFPRTGMKNKENQSFLQTEIPPDLKQAQLELAIQLWESQLTTQGTSEVTSYTTTGVTASQKAKESGGSRQDAIPSVVYDLLGPYGKFRINEVNYNLSRSVWG